MFVLIVPYLFVSESYRSIPEYSRHSITESSPVYTQSDFVRFPTKTYNHKSAVINHVIHGNYLDF